jgi:hypothetical protein
LRRMREAHRRRQAPVQPFLPGETRPWREPRSPASAGAPSPSPASPSRAPGPDLASPHAPRPGARPLNPQSCIRSLPFLRRGTRQPGATLETGMPSERPLTQPDQNAIMGSAFRFRSGGYGQDAQGLVPAKGPGRHFAAVQPESGQDQDLGRCAF